jgi:hypothetical protein
MPSKVSAGAIQVQLSGRCRKRLGALDERPPLVQKKSPGVSESEPTALSQFVSSSQASTDAARPLRLTPDGRYCYRERPELAEGSLLQKSQWVVRQLNEATAVADRLTQELKGVTDGQRSALGDPIQHFNEVRADLLAALTDVASLRAAYGELHHDVEATIESLTTEEQRLVEGLKRIKDTAAFDPLTWGDPVSRVNGVAEAHGEVTRRLEEAKKALLALNTFSVPGNAWDKTYGSISGSVSAGMPGWWSLYADVGLRRTEKTYDRDPEVVPTGAIGLDTSFVDVAYVASTVKGGSGLSTGVSLIPLVSLGQTPGGRYASVDIPGLVGVGLTERGEISFYVTVPITPTVGLGVDLKVGNPNIRGATGAVLGQIDKASLTMAEWLASVQSWLGT